MTGPVRTAAIAVAAAVVLFAGLGRADLFNPDEPREAEIAREMRVSGDRVVPRLNGESFLEKPPLFYWLVTGAYAILGGPGERAARLVPAICGWLTVLVTWLFGRRLVGDRAAALAAAILMTSFLFFWTARRAMIDMPLTCAIALTCFALHRAIAERGGRAAGWLAAGAAAGSAALLFKGLVGAGIPALALLGFLAARRDLSALWRRGLAAAGVAALLPVAAWTAMLYHRLGEAGVREFVWVNHVLRFSGGASKGHDQPFHYYASSLLTDLAPWGILLPFAIAAAFLALRRREAADREPLLFLLSWFVLPLVVLSIASTKRGIYLLPVGPAAALLLGWWLAPPDAGPGATASGTASGAARDRWPWRARPILLGLLVATGILVASGSLGIVRLIRPGGMAMPIAFGIVLATPLAMAALALRVGAVTRAAWLLAASTAILSILLTVVMVPEVVNRYTTPRRSAGRVARMADAGDRVALYRVKEGSLGGWLFYARRTFPHLQTPESLARHLASDSGPGSGRALALMSEAAWAEVGPALSAPAAVVARLGPRPAILRLRRPGGGVREIAIRTGEPMVLVASRAAGAGA